MGSSSVHLKFKLQVHVLSHHCKRLTCFPPPCMPPDRAQEKITNYVAISGRNTVPLRNKLTSHTQSICACAYTYFFVIHLCFFCEVLLDKTINSFVRNLKSESRSITAKFAYIYVNYVETH